MGDIIHGLGLNATIVAQFINLIVLLFLISVFIIFPVVFFVYLLRSIADLKQRVRRLEDLVINRDRPGTGKLDSMC